MPLRMSVRPTAGHTRTPLGTGIIVALAPRRQPPPKRATPKPGSARALPANSISIAGTDGMATPSPARATTPERTRWPRLEDPAASDRSNSASRRPVAPRRTTAPGPNAAATIACFCSPPPDVAGPARTSTLAIAPSLAVVQTPVFTPLRNQATSNRTMKGGLPGAVPRGGAFGSRRSLANA
jgi:hypothetical protein